MRDKPRLLDLYCKAGGASMGYFKAGFDVVGVDIEPQPRYPFYFSENDALWVLESLIAGNILRFRTNNSYPVMFGLEDFDAIHASPPCQGYGRLQINTKYHPKLIEPTRDCLLRTGKPFIIENVPGAPLIDPLVLCGSMFEGLRVWRHRLFEIHGFKVKQPICQHERVPEPLDVTGTGGPCNHRRTKGGGLHRKPRNMAEARTAMGNDWMTRKELVESVPQAYTYFIGKIALEKLWQNNGGGVYEKETEYYRKGEE